MADNGAYSDDGAPDNDDDLFGDGAAASSAGPAPPSVPVPAPVTVSGTLARFCAGTVAIHAATVSSQCEETDEQARVRATLATKAVRKVIFNAASEDPEVWQAWQDPVTALESLLYSQSNDTTREAAGSVANIVESSLAPRAVLADAGVVLVHASQRSLPVDGGYGPSFPVAGGRMLVEERGDAAPPPRVTLTFPLSDPHFPFRCARIDLTKSAEGLLCVTAHRESDRRLSAPAAGVSIGPAEGSRVLSAASVERLFAPSQSPDAERRRALVGWWVGLYDLDAGLQRRSAPDGAIRAYVAPNFLTRALAHLATRNLRLHVVANAAAAGQGGKLTKGSLWQSAAFEPATLHARHASDDDHAFYLRAPLHQTFCRCLCGAYAPLAAAGHTNASDCQPCLDIYVCGRALVDGRCPTHAACTRLGAHGVCVARTSLRLKCVHGRDDAPAAVSTAYATYNSLDHELLLAPAEKMIVREIAASAVHLRKCAIAAPLAAALAPPEYLRAERRRLDGALVELYDKNDRDEREDVEDPADALVHGVEGFVRNAMDECLRALDDQAAKLMCAGGVAVEIGKDWSATEGSFPDGGKLRVQPQIALLRGVTKLWRASASGDGSRTRIGSSLKNGKELEYIYGRLFAHRRAPARRRCAPSLPRLAESPPVLSAAFPPRTATRSPVPRIFTL